MKHSKTFCFTSTYLVLPKKLSTYYSPILFWWPSELRHVVSNIKHLMNFHLRERAIWFFLRICFAIQNVISSLISIFHGPRVNSCKPIKYNTVPYFVGAKLTFFMLTSNQGQLLNETSCVTISLHKYSYNLKVNGYKWRYRRYVMLRFSESVNILKELRNVLNLKVLFRYVILG